MNFYVSLIHETVDYIEANLSTALSLVEISRKFCVSEFHFNRMFKTVVGQTLKQYIQGRRLTLALERLNETDQSVLEIGLSLGFEYPEVFSRAFKKQFGLSPVAYRRRRSAVNPVEKATVVDRDLMNFRGAMTLKGDFVEIKELKLAGIALEVNPDAPEFAIKVNAKYHQLIRESSAVDGLKNERFFSAVNCHGADSGVYTLFMGFETEPAGPAGNFPQDFQDRRIPGGQYAAFSYYGDMFAIRETFVDDLYRWIMVQEIELDSNGVGMLNVFDQGYPQTREVKILVPVGNPRTKARNIMKVRR